ncbi:MAG TPA: hypothetical protein VK970_16370 [Candidatus Methylacidiphilales bacterium]|nr:hypothetical protein [Candidatus Methylacidiphilales bacterium]
MTTSLLHWDFPLPRCHTGIPLGNGIQGLLIWGQGATLNITVSRAGFWHHGLREPYQSNATYKEVKRLVEARDEEALKALFVGKAGIGIQARPFQLGGGRLVLSFGGGYQLLRAQLDLPSAAVEVVLENGAGRCRSLYIRQAMDAELAWVEGLEQPDLQPVELKLIPSWDFLEAKLSEIGLKAPERWEGSGVDPKVMAIRGFMQCMPHDDALTVETAWDRTAGCLFVVTALGDKAGRGIADSMISARPLDEVRQATQQWWTNYWLDVPQLDLPAAEAELQQSYQLGLYKQAGMSTPGGVAATLQGPWMEDDAIPPWSNDYHFNINVQLVYGSVLPTNRAAHMAPLWNLVLAWMPALRQKGETFFEAPGAMMLPHAVDDRCNVIGTFWTGTIDHACTAWMAQMAWMHYRYTLDEKVLREIAWPLLVGAFEGYWAMAEVSEDGSLTIPLSVSPEYNGSSLSACGRDASFQLAAFHCIAQIMPRAAMLIGKIADPRWAEVSVKLPPYILEQGERPSDKGSRIGLWVGQDLAESHRHHAHLAGIWPFQTFEPHAEEHWEIVGRTIRHWGKMGAGQWTGWCLPWASIICTRCGLPDAALAWLKWWRHVFTNVGHGTLHDSDFSGAGGGFGWRGLDRPGFVTQAGFHEIMQMDAAMSAVTAILELLVQSRADVITVLTRLPKNWRDFRFERIRTEGAFLVSAEVTRGKVIRIGVTSEKGGLLKLRHAFPGEVHAFREGKIVRSIPATQIPLGEGESTLLEQSIEAGETLEFVPA